MRMVQLITSLCIFKLAIFFVSICHCISWCNGCVEEERTALLQIKDSINNPSGSSLDHDWVGKDCCNWSGIECNQSSSRVAAIYLSGTRDYTLGTWYPNATLFAQFKELGHLDLSYNNIGGWVMPQGLCELKNLQTLHLGDNNLDGRALPPCVSSNLSVLEELYLHYNNLGSSPGALTGLCGLRALRNLSLGYNNLKSLPMCLGNISMLERLYLRGNNLIGSSIGDWIQGLKGLDVLDLSRSGFTDESISPWISNLTSLSDLDLSWNQLKGSNTVKGLCGLRALHMLDLSSNMLNSLPLCLGNLSMLEDFDLSYNNLTGGSFGNSIQGWPNQD